MTPTTNLNFQEREISGENSLMLNTSMKRGLSEAEEQVTKKQHCPNNNESPKVKKKKKAWKSLSKENCVENSENIHWSD